MAQILTTSMATQGCPRAAGFAYHAGVFVPGPKPGARTLGDLFHCLVEDEVEGALPGFGRFDVALGRARAYWPAEQVDAMVVEARHYAERYLRAFPVHEAILELYEVERRFVGQVAGFAFAAKPDLLWAATESCSIGDGLESERVDLEPGDLVYDELKTTSDRDRATFLGTVHASMQVFLGAHLVEAELGLPVKAVRFRAVRKVVSEPEKLVTKTGKLSTDAKLLFDESTLRAACAMADVPVPEAMIERARATALVYSTVVAVTEERKARALAEAVNLGKLYVYAARLGYPPRRNDLDCRMCDFREPCQAGVLPEQARSLDLQSRYGMRSSSYREELEATLSFRLDAEASFGCEPDLDEAANLESATGRVVRSLQQPESIPELRERLRSVLRTLLEDDGEAVLDPTDVDELNDNALCALAETLATREAA